MNTTPVLLLFVPSVALAQVPDAREAQPERPTVATHAHTVAPGFFEIESGVEADRFDDHSRAWAFLSNLKFGLARHAQLNVFVPMVGGDGMTGGLGDLAAGIKWRLLDKHPVLGDFAILPVIKAATGSRVAGRGTGTTDLSLIVISSRMLGPVSMDLNAGATLRSGDGSTAPKHAYVWAASFYVPIGSGVGWCVEYFGYPAASGPAGSPAYSALLTGPTLTVKPWLVLDVGGIVPFAGDQTWALYAGVVWNAGRLWRRAP